MKLTLDQLYKAQCRSIGCILGRTGGRATIEELQAAFNGDQYPDPVTSDVIKYEATP